MNDLVDSVERYLLDMTWDNGGKLFENVIAGASESDVLSSVQNNKGGAFFQMTQGTVKRFSYSQPNAMPPIILHNVRLRVAVVSIRSKQVAKDFTKQAWNRIERFLKNYHTSQQRIVSQSNANDYYIAVLDESPIEAIEVANNLVMRVDFIIDKVILAKE